MPSTVTESNLLAKQIKQIEANGRGQQQALIKGFKDLNDILGKLLGATINKEELNKLNLKIELLNAKVEISEQTTRTCTHSCKSEEDKEKVVERKYEEKSVKTKKDNIPVPTPPQFNLQHPEQVPIPQTFSSPYLSAAKSKLKKQG